MADEPQVEDLHFTERWVLTVRSWPQRTSFGLDWLKQPHVNRATIRGDVVTFTLDNGTASYRLRRDLPRRGGSVVADLIDGTLDGEG